MPLRSTRRLLVALAAIVTTAGAGVLTAVPATAATGTGSISGHVVLTDGSPAAEVPLRITTLHSDEPNHVYSATTDAAGDYTVTEVVPEQYDVFPQPGSMWGLERRTGVTVKAGATVKAATATLVRLAVVHGSVVSAADGRPIAGMTVTSSASTPVDYGGSGIENYATTAADGSYTLVTAPGWVRITSGIWNRWFSDEQRVWVDEGKETRVGALVLVPSGLVSTQIVGRSGQAIRYAWTSAVVDGCSVSLDHSCPGVEIAGTVADALQLAPGTHTIRYEVSNPFNRIVRKVTRTAVVEQGETTTLAPVVVRADPYELTKVHTSSYRRGQVISLRVDAPSYMDGTRPHLRTTFLVGGHVVTPTSVKWRTSKTFVAKLPAKWSTHKTLKVQAVVHGTTAYAGQTTKAVVLTRAK